MGWTTYMATHYKNGKVDRKAELDAMYNWTDNNGVKHTVLKSRMVGSTYYAAVSNGNETVAAVCLTCGKGRGRYDDGMNFGYKPMDESMGPCECDCPESILKLLTPIDSEYAKAWREKCWNKIKKKKEGKTLSSLPVGTIIKFTLYNGNECMCYKHAPGYQFKRPFWMKADGQQYVQTKRIPDNFEVVGEM